MRKVNKMLRRMRLWLWERQLRKAYEWKVKSDIDFKAAEKLINLLVEHGKEHGMKAVVTMAGKPITPTPDPPPTPSVRDAVVLLLDHFGAEIVHKETGKVFKGVSDFEIRRRDDR